MKPPMGTMTPELKERLKQLIRRIHPDDRAAWIAFLTDFGVEMCKQGYENPQNDPRTPS